MLRTKLAVQHLNSIVYQHIKNNPGQRCFEIDDATLQSHHQWMTKSILHNLEREGKIYCVKRTVDGIMREPGKPDVIVWKKIPPTYFTYTN